MNTPIRWTLAALCLSMLLSSLGTSIANVGLPNLAQAFNASFQEVQWVVLAYLLAITTSIVSVGRLGGNDGDFAVDCEGVDAAGEAGLLAHECADLRHGTLLWD